MTIAARTFISRVRSNESRIGSKKRFASRHHEWPAAGAHAAHHLMNEDATPGSGVLPSIVRFGREVDGAAG